MPPVQVRVYCDSDREAPFLEWLTTLRRRQPRAYSKCVYLLSMLAQFGATLSRPTAAPLRDGVWELRGRVGSVNYRILYGLVGSGIAVVSHAITKEKEVPTNQITLAKKRLDAARNDLELHTTDLEIDEP